MAEQGGEEPWGAPGVNEHPDAREVLKQIISLEHMTVARDLLKQGMCREPMAFYDDPHPAGLLLAHDIQSYVMRVGALLGAQKITAYQAAALVRGLGVTLLNPDEDEREVP